MFRRFNIYSEDMALALVVWLCSLPLIGFLVIPVWGVKTAGSLALFVLVAIMMVCWGFCGWKIFRK
jgi:hypothetical protein